jgi:FdhD protein
LLERVRVRLVEGSCGLCGLESIEQVMRPLPRIEPGFRTTPAAVRRALTDLPGRQVQGSATRATHAAAFCAADGAILCIREDVGRHNALDKLFGALARQGVDPASGFALVSARCSYELVEKAVRAGCPMLVAISAPTTLAAERAQAADLTLLALARHDTVLVVNDPHDLMKGMSDGF